jgi:hypothetical protein
MVRGFLVDLRFDSRICGDTSLNMKEDGGVRTVARGACDGSVAGAVLEKP